MYCINSKGCGCEIWAQNNVCDECVHVYACVPTPM